MRIRLALLAAVMIGAVVKAAAAPAATQARAAVDTSRVYDGEPARPEASAVFAGAAPAARDAERIAEEERRAAALRNGLALRPIGRPDEPPTPAKKALTAWNPLLNGARGAVLGGIIGFVLGGPLGLLVGAAVFGAAAWGLSKVDDA